MNAKTYQAESMAEALAEVKRDLGRDAVILQTRSFRKGGLLGFIGGRPMWEVTATPNMNIPRRVPRAQASLPVTTAVTALADMASGRFDPSPAVRAAATAVDEAPVLPQPMIHLSPRAASPAPKSAAAPDALKKQVEDIRGMVETLLTRSSSAPAAIDVPAPLAHFHQRLMQRDVPAEVSADLLRQVHARLDAHQLSEPRLVIDKLIEVIEQRLPVAACEVRPSQGKPRVIAMIGPTGVGKTTTIAKMAANFQLQQSLRVGLITVDTYRIAAVDQLRTYAEIIEVPIRAVLTAGELHQAIQGMSDLDVLLIDTAGRSQNDQMRLNQLRTFLGAASADEVHLVVSAAANSSCLRTTLDRFLPLGATRIIISKVDEAETFGMILQVARAQVPMSFVTTGQDVPDDISPANARRLARWIVGEDQNAD